MGKRSVNKTRAAPPAKKNKVHRAPDPECTRCGNRRLDDFLPSEIKSRHWECRKCKYGRDDGVCFFTGHRGRVVEVEVIDETGRTRKALSSIHPARQRQPILVSETVTRYLKKERPPWWEGEPADEWTMLGLFVKHFGCVPFTRQGWWTYGKSQLTPQVVIE